MENAGGAGKAAIVKRGAGTGRSRSKERFLVGIGWFFLHRLAGMRQHAVWRSHGGHRGA